MRKLKKAFSLTLALALSLALAVPAMAAGEVGSTTIQDEAGFSYTLSKPVVGTRVIEGLGLFYQIPEGTIITPVLPEGTIKKVDEYGEVSYKLADDAEGRKQVARFDEYADDYLDGYYDFVVTYIVGEFVDGSTIYGPEYEGTWDTMAAGHLEGVYDGDPIQPLSKGLYYLLRQIDCSGISVDPNKSESTGGGFNGGTISGFHGVNSEVKFEVVPDNGSATPDQPTASVEPEQPTAPATPDAPGTYTVKKGDSCSSICTNFYGTNAQRYALMRVNKNIKLNEGAVLTLPEKLGKDTLLPAATAGEGEKLYTVKAGDTLGKIAAAEYGKTGEYKAIFERNADRLKNANTIYEGQVIVLPAKK